MGTSRNRPGTSLSPRALWTRGIPHFSLDHRNAALCAALAVVSVLATIPFLETSFNDDWSYTFTALQLAETGKLTYNGWGALIVGVQAAWAALIIRLFGFSFTAVRLSTLVFDAGSALLLYAFGRRAGLRPSLAVFGTLAVVLSPLFIPLAASFMTDVPGLFFLLACAYCALRALDASRAGIVLVWTALAALTGVLGGTVRQIVWAEPVLVLPCLAWTRRKEHRIAAAVICFWCGSLVVIALSLHWYQGQPFAVPEGPLWRFPQASPPFSAVWDALFRMGVSFALVMLPALAVYASARPVDLERLARAGAVLVIPWALWKATSPWSPGYIPMLGNIITPHGILDGLDAIGDKPMTLTRPLRGLLAAMVVAAACPCLASFFHSFALWRKAAQEGKRSSLPRIRAHFALAFLPFSIAYFALLIRRIYEGPIFDRYLLPLLPAVVVALLLHFQNSVRRPAPLPAWVVLVLWALYGVASMHDYLAATRARLSAAAAVAAKGVPRTAITAGLEYDAWTQLQQTGYVNNERMVKPTPAQPKRNRPASAGQPAFWFWQYTGSVNPRYFIVYSLQPGLQNGPFPVIRYTAWLPPFHRAVFTQILPQVESNGPESAGRPVHEGPK